MLLKETYFDMQIFLVGTAHVSRASSEEVRDMIHAVKPQTVFVELDAKRAQSILMGGQENQSEACFLTAEQLILHASLLLLCTSVCLVQAAEAVLC